ncbi:MAG: ABC transporter ATP-binding protein/permease [Clostridiales bacterium]|jgi:ATP-binding cassette subfamily B protein|nr:ABC transporter ATP-binding protein/permease [Clostridiales bacterium]
MPSKTNERHREPGGPDKPGGPGGLGARGPAARPQNTKKVLRRMMAYMGKYKLRLILVFALVSLSALSNVVASYMLTPLINNYIVPFIGSANPNLAGLAGMLMFVAGVYVAGALASLLYQRVMVTISVNTLNSIRLDMFQHMQTLPIRYFDAHTHGEIMSRYTNDVDTMRQLLSQSLVQFFLSGITVISVFVAMLVLNPVLTLLAVGTLVLMLLTIRLLGRSSGAYFRRQQAALGAANGYIEEMVEGQKVVKVFSHETAAKAEFQKLNDELFRSAQGANTFATMIMPIMNNLSYINYALTAMAGGIMAAAGTFTLGALASFLMYTRSFANPIAQVSNQFNMVLQALAGAERIFALIDELSEVDEGTVRLVSVKYDENGALVESPVHTGIWTWRNDGDTPVSYTLLRGDVRFEHVTFGYEPDKTVLHDLSLYAKPGHKIAFVGSTGAGKTTITNLLTRFYDIQEGKITYDGIDIKDIKKDDLRSSLAMVLQDTHLFTGTVRDNIRFGKLDASDNEVMRAAKLANAHSFIRHLPDGYDTMITGDGANLSQGQRQLLAIARAALANPPVLVLDEATSSIDTRTEAIIEQGMDQLMQGRTVFVIAHRLSTVRNAKAIMVLENGEIIERGDHDDLVAQKGKYYQLYTGAFELA